MKNIFQLVFFAAAVFVFSIPAARADNPDSIIYSKHNLSVSSPGTIHASSETEVCIFCHTPHLASSTADGPLWNHAMSAVGDYKPYYSGTMKATVGQPTGSSRLCLSCHDGTVALGSVQSRLGEIAMTDTLLPASSPDFVGKDLTSTHPVSFVYDQPLAVADGNLVYPNTLPPEVQLDRSGQMQCTSCHDPHNNQFGYFLVRDNSTAGLCLACHVLPGWATSGHGLSGATLPQAVSRLVALQSGRPQSKAAARTMTVAGAGCASCHLPHAAGGKQSLTWFTAPEKNCFTCHAAEGPGKDVSNEFNKISAHPVLLNADAHSGAENLVNPPVRHVTCADCHNPHAANKSAGGKLSVSGALAGVQGVGAGGSAVRSVTHEYELCFRCHGDSAARGPARVTRQLVQTNTRLEFNPGNTSFHPVETVGKNANVPSLIPPLTTSSVVACSDCHNNDQSSAAGGSGPNGPHGSAFIPLLERRVSFTDGAPYNPDDAALCYKCHNSAVVDSDLPTSWSGHRKHIEDYRAACTTCHDSHAATQPHLINFNTTYVQPVNGVLRYVSTGLNHGNCTLTCHDGAGHNKTHKAVAY